MPYMRNKRTGELVEVDANGMPVSQGPQMPPRDPTFDYKGPQAGAQLDQTRTAVAGQQIDNQFDSATLPARVRKAEAEASQAEIQVKKAQRDLTVPDETGRKVATQNAGLDALGNQINRVQDLYNKSLRNEPYGWLSSLGDFLPTSKNDQFNTAAAGMAEQGLGAFRVPGVGSQSDAELRQFVQANRPSASDFDSSIEEKLMQMRSRVDAARKAAGLPPTKWTGVPQQDEQIAAAAGFMGPGAGGGNGPTPPTFSPGDPGYQAATGNTRSVSDPATAAELDKLVRSGASLEELNRYAMSKGLAPVNPQEYSAVRDYLQKNPGYQGGLVNARKYEPLTMFEKGATAIGNNPVGAYALGAGQFLSGNTLDNVAGDPERARLALGMMDAQNPTATTLGEISGGIMASLGGEAALGRMGVSPGLLRGGIVDAATGAANGAGAADGGNRLTGALQGGTSSAIGGVTGSLGTRGLGRMVGATGGAQRPLYDAGVRPTLGQRVADKGFVGRAVNNAEQALQSVPIVGSAIQGARQEARDQFQVGAFNEALKEVGEALPRGMRPGTDPHAYVQKVFNRVYDEARGGMKLVADEELANDFANLAPDIQTLGPAAQNKLRSIIKNTIDNRMSSGRLEGKAYKQATSDLGKHIARLRKSAMADDQQLGEVLSGIQGGLDSAARRYSDPEAIKLLDAADAGYAKLVRIEGAAARRGGDDGTFSPKQFSSEVQKASGGVRSRSYLRGDALMQDYANAGKSLDDTLPNSGTVDRALVGGGLVGGTALGGIPPAAVAGLAGIGAAYAPGVRKAMQSALKPAGPKRNAIAEQLRKRERMIGRSTGATVGALLLGTAPSQ